MHARFYTVSLVAAGLLLGTGANLPGYRQSHLAVFAQTAAEQAPPLGADQLVEQGNQANQSGDFQAAIELWQQALAAYRASGNRQTEAEVLISIGRAYYGLDQIQPGNAALEQAATIAQENDQPRLAAIAFLTLGSQYLQLAQYSPAVENFQQALARSQASDSDDLEAIALQALLGAHLLLGQYQQLDLELVPRDKSEARA